jgi:hypothetical protein
VPGLGPEEPGTPAGAEIRTAIEGRIWTVIPHEIARERARMPPEQAAEIARIALKRCPPPAGHRARDRLGTRRTGVFRCWYSP